MTVKCLYHCAMCNRHFRSLRGFDEHKERIYGKHEKFGWYGVLSTSCKNPPEHFVKVRGVCDNGPTVLEDVPIWREVGARDSREDL